MNGLEITRIKFRFRSKDQNPNVLANVSVSFNYSLSIDDVRFCYNQEFNKYKLIFPARKIGEEYYDFVRMPGVMYRAILARVIADYELMQSQGQWKNAG